MAEIDRYKPDDRRAVILAATPAGRKLMEEGRTRRTALLAKRLAALPSYHAWYVALWIVVPAALFALLWNAIAPQLVVQAVLADPAAASLPAFGMQRETLLEQARAVATGAAPGVFNPAANALIGPFREAIFRFNAIGLAVTLVIALTAGAYAFLRLKPDFAARTRVERGVMAALLLASLVAILRTATRTATNSSAPSCAATVRSSTRASRTT